LALVRPVPGDDAASQIFVIDADGVAQQVTGVSGGLGASHPVWSRDGEQLAFGGAKVGEPGIGGQVALVNRDGSNEREVADGQTPQWSPDGTRIAFTEVDDVTGEDLSMYVIDVASGEITDLGLGYSPRWIDDGRLVFNANVYAADGSARFDAFTLDPSTGERQPLAEETIAYPSPDGTMLLLEQDGVISLASADGSDPEELVNGVNPVWSPDGTRFAFAYDHDADANPIHAIVDLEGGTVISDLAGATPTWSPDGTRMAVEVYRPDMPVVQVIDVASGEVVWEEEGLQPAWRP
jgi:Tol biopolymer transport system component